MQVEEGSRAILMYLALCLSRYIVATASSLVYGKVSTKFDSAQRSLYSISPGVPRVNVLASSYSMQLAGRNLSEARFRHIPCAG